MLLFFIQNYFLKLSSKNPQINNAIKPSGGQAAIRTNTIALDKQPSSKGSVWLGRGNLLIILPYPIIAVLPKTNPQHFTISSVPVGIGISSYFLLSEISLSPSNFFTYPKLLIL